MGFVGIGLRLGEDGKLRISLHPRAYKGPRIGDFVNDIFVSKHQKLADKSEQNTNFERDYRQHARTSFTVEEKSRTRICSSIPSKLSAVRRNFKASPEQSKRVRSTKNIRQSKSLEMKKSFKSRMREKVAKSKEKLTGESPFSEPGFLAAPIIRLHEDVGGSKSNEELPTFLRLAETSTKTSVAPASEKKSTKSKKKGKRESKSKRGKIEVPKTHRPHRATIVYKLSRKSKKKPSVVLNDLLSYEVYSSQPDLSSNHSPRSPSDGRVGISRTCSFLSRRAGLHERLVKAYREAKIQHLLFRSEKRFVKSTKSQQLLWPSQTERSQGVVDHPCHHWDGGIVSTP